MHIRLLFDTSLYDTHIEKLVKGSNLIFSVNWRASESSKLCHEIDCLLFVPRHGLVTLEESIALSYTNESPFNLKYTEVKVGDIVTTLT